MGTDPESSSDEWKAPDQRFGDMSGKDAIFSIIYKPIDILDLLVSYFTFIFYFFFKMSPVVPITAKTDVVKLNHCKASTPLITAATPASFLVWPGTYASLQC